MAEKENNKKLQDIENQKYALSLKEMEILKREKMLVLLLIIQLIYDHKVGLFSVQHVAYVTCPTNLLNFKTCI